MAADQQPAGEQPAGDEPGDGARPAGARPAAGRRAVDALLTRLDRVTVWQFLLVVAIGAYTWYFTWVSLDVHHGLGTSSYDSALYDQGIWLMSRFKAPFVTLMGRNLMGDHASFVLVLLVPLYWLWPSAGVLFFTQSLFIALGALPVFLYARKRLGSEAMALVLAAAFLLHPAVGLTNRENYHPDSFLAFFVGMAIYAALERKWRLYAVFLVLTLLVKEDVLLVIVPLGVWVALNRNRRIGLATMLATLGATFVGMVLVMRSLIGVPTRNGWRIPFGGPTGLLREIIERPGNVIEHLRSDGRPFYVWQMAFPMGFAFLRKPSVAAISAVVLFTNILSTFVYQYRIDYHYSLVAVPAIVLGSVYAIGAMREKWKRPAVAGVALTALWSSLMWGVVPLGAILTPGSNDPIGRPLPYYWHADHPAAVAARELFAMVPGGASVSAYHALTPHLAHRTLIYQFPNPFRVVLYGPDSTLEDARACLPTAETVEYVMLKRAIDPDQLADWEVVQRDFTVVAENDWFVLYHRTAHAVKCRRQGSDPFPTLVVDGA